MKQSLYDEHSSQLGTINATQALIVISVINLIGYFFAVAEVKNINSDHMPILMLINNIKCPRVHYDISKRDTKNVVVKDFVTEVAIICNNLVMCVIQLPHLLLIIYLKT